MDLHQSAVDDEQTGAVPGAVDPLAALVATSDRCGRDPVLGLLRQVREERHRLDEVQPMVVPIFHRRPLALPTQYGDDAGAVEKTGGTADNRRGT